MPGESASNPSWWRVGCYSNSARIDARIDNYERRLAHEGQQGNRVHAMLAAMKLMHLTIAGMVVGVLSINAVHAAENGECPRTLGSSETLGPPFPSSDNWYGSEALAVILRPEGIWSGMGPSHNYRDKLFWWSLGFKPGMESNLKVSGKRLDKEAPAADISRATNAHAKSLGGWTMLVGVEFPTAGCWQVTGEYLGQKLSFVVEVR